MRHLKKFEELNIETYINAGDNLKKVGHLERGQKLIDWAKKGKLGDVGEFNIWIKWMTSYPATATSRKGITSGIISDTPITDTIEDSFTIVINSFPKTGNIFFMACGSIINLID